MTSIEGPTTHSLQVLEAAARRLAPHLAPRRTDTGCYGLAYGSHADGSSSGTSDLDVLLVAQHPLTAHEVGDMTDIVLRLHQDHGLNLDTEVAYEVKLTAAHRDVRAAVELEAFPYPPRPGHPVAAAVPADADYLNSGVFRLRLLLNALTSPNVFLGGDLDTFHRHVRAAEAALALLALRVGLHRRPACAPMALTMGEVLDAVTVGPDNAHGHDYLGYRRAPSTMATLNRGLHQLLAAGIAAHDAGTGWRPGPCWAGGMTTVLGYWP